MKQGVAGNLDCTQMHAKASGTRREARILLDVVAHATGPGQEARPNVLEA